MTFTDFPDETRDAAASDPATSRRRDFSVASARFEAATSASPADGQSWLGLARVRALSNDLSGAREACAEAARLAPDDLRAVLLGARLAAKADDGRARIAYLKLAAALRPGAVAIRLQLLGALQRRIQHRPALAVAEELLAIAPNDPAVRLAAARCHLTLGGLAEAEAEIERSGTDEAFDVERARLRDDLAARRQRAAVTVADAPAAAAVTALPTGKTARSPAVPRPSTTAATTTGATLADVEGLVTAATLRAIERSRRRPRLSDHMLIIRALVLRDLRAHYRHSVLGASVELIRPAVVVFVHDWLFYYLKKPMPGEIPVAVYVLAGFSTWFAFQASWAGASMGGKWPAGATAWPGVTDLHLRIAKAAWGLMLNLAFCILALVPLALIGLDYPSANIVETCLIFSMAGGMGFGLGLLLERLGQHLAFVKTVEKLLTWGLFVTSGLYFSLATTPALVAQYYWYNPLLHLIEYERHAFDPGYPVALVSLSYPAMFTVGLLITGLLVYRSVGCRDQD